MKTRKTYWRRWLRWSYEATRSQPPWWSILTWLVTILATIIIRGIPDSFFKIPASVQELDASDIARFVASFPIALVLLWLISLVRAPGNIDSRLHDEFEEAIRQAKDDTENLDLQRQAEIESLKEQSERLSQRLEGFEKRLRPNIWITGKVYGNSPISDIYSRDGGTNVGFTVENKSDSDLCDVQVALVKLKYSFPDHHLRGDCKFITDEDMGHITKFPIMLEWSPDEQVASGVLSATIPARTSRLVGLFSMHSILSASPDIRSSLLVSMGFVYKVAVQISARGIPAITTGDYIVTRIGTGREEEIPFKIEPEGAVQISGAEEK